MAGFASISRAVCLSIVLVPFLVPPLRAQVTTGADGRTIVPRDTADAPRHQTLFTYRDAALAAGFVGLTVAMFPADKQIAKNLQSPDLQNNKLFDNPARGVELITSPGAFIIGGGLYAVGRIGGYKDLQDLGWHGTEAVLLASGVTGLLKGVLGRSRPYATADSTPRDFNFLKGFGRGTYGINPTNGKPLASADYQSFPSGHTTTAFAAAAAVTSEARRMWPGTLWIVAPVMYGGATLVGLSRMYHNNHWASDVVVGAGIGTFSGLKVVRYSHAHPDNKLDQFMMGATILPSAGGATLAFSLPAP